ncbi:MAG: hypothetical protein OEW39_07635 [Deltaproteobacteria bacterium]|nr:hypothetical protein [Deltaproteobacteria bacterium]
MPYSEIFHRVFIRGLKTLPLWFGVVGMVYPALVHAYVPDLKELEALIQSKGNRLERAYIETRTWVYNPTPVPGEQEGTAERPPLRLPEQGFLQKIYWIRQSFLGIETYSESGELLHFYWQEGVDPVAVNLKPERTFALSDILPAYLPYVEANPDQWRRGMGDWGLSPYRVELVRGSKDTLYYRLAEGPHTGVWLERATLHPVRLDTEVAGGGDPLRLTLEFFDFVELLEASSNTSTVYFPFITNYLLNGRLFRQTQVVEFQVNPKERDFPVTAMRKRAQELTPPHPVQLLPAPGTKP